jgi:hypothetical protein
VADEHYQFSAEGPSAPAGFERPRAVDGATLAFPALVIGTLLPPRDAIPREFRESTRASRQLFDRWFFEGLRDATFTPRPGIDLNAALRHVSACMRSYQPSHEHKEEGVAFLLECFFSRVDIRAAASAEVRRG